VVMRYCDRTADASARWQKGLWRAKMIFSTWDGHADRQHGFMSGGNLVGSLT
jgi:hypothetical protein